MTDKLDNKHVAVGLFVDRKIAWREEEKVLIQLMIFKWLHVLRPTIIRRYYRLKHHNRRYVRGLS